MQTISRQRIGKHVPATTNTHTTIELLLETVFSTPSAQNGYKEENWGVPVVSSLLISSWEAAKIEPERAKLKNLHV
jgi:hypothetical protein